LDCCTPNKSIQQHGAIMTSDDMIELVQLATAICPIILQDLHLMTSTDLEGALLYLRNRAKEGA